jgi:hypothetical protein
MKKKGACATNMSLIDLAFSKGIRKKFPDYPHAPAVFRKRSSIGRKNKLDKNKLDIHNLE